MIEEKYLKAANMYTKLAYCTIDAAETFVNEVTANLAHVGKDLRQSDKMKFKMCLNYAKQLQNLMNNVTYDIYHMEETTAALDDSDYISDIIALIIDRSGNNPLIANEIMENIKKLPTKLNIIN